MTVSTLPLRRNKFGHQLMRITGRGLFAAQESICVERARCDQITDPARRLLLGVGAETYNQEHRLEREREYMIALVPWGPLGGSSSPSFSERTNANFLRQGECCGYLQPVAEQQFRIHERLTPELMKELGLYWIASLHRPIKDEHGNDEIFYSRLYGEDLLVTLASGSPDHDWHDKGAFAFPVF